LKLRPPPETKLKGGAKVPILKMIHDRHGTPVGSFVQFTDENSGLDDAAKQRLDDLIPLLVGKQNKVEIRGHTARRRPAPDGTAPNPWKLSYDRCMATMDYLVEHGIDISRIRLSQAGPYEPSVSSENTAWRLRNSRVEVIMLNEYIDDFTVTKRRPEEENEAAGEDDEEHGADDPHADDKKKPADGHAKH
jgi:hypothetical protein